MIKKIILPALAALILFACSGDHPGIDLINSGETPATPAAIQKAKIYGVAQKGPFVEGAEVKIYELDDKYEKTKNSFKGKTNAKGYYEIEIKSGKLASPYVIIEASGKYNNEVSGEKSNDKITLKAVADVSNKDNVNINVLTDLESDKVIKLAKSGKSFEDSKKQAQKEVLTALGVKESVARNSEDMGLFGGNTSDNVLLTVSVALQNNKTEAEISALLADLSGTGKFDVAKEFEKVDKSKVRTNILALEPSAKVPDTFKPGSSNNNSNNSNNNNNNNTSNNNTSNNNTSNNNTSNNNTSNNNQSNPYTCNGKTYDPESQYCEGGYVKEKVKCGNYDYDPAIEICENNVIVIISSNSLATIEASKFTLDHIQYWVGKGKNRAVMIVHWNDGKKPEALAWGYRWDGTKTGYDMIDAIAKADSRFFYLKGNTNLGVAIGGIGFDAGGVAKIGKGSSCQSPVDGSVSTSGYGYDDWKVCNKTNAHWFAGWYNGYWSYYVSDDSDNAGGLGYSRDAGVDLRKLQNNSMDAWYARHDTKIFSAGDPAPLSVITAVSNPSGISTLQPCGADKYYDPETHFCTRSGNNPKVVELCEGKGYDTRTKICLDDKIQEIKDIKCGGEQYDLAKQFCYENSKVGNFCGNREDIYDPDMYECRPSVNTNGIYLKRDIEYQGKKYAAVLIGKNTWMAENLNYAAEGSKCGTNLNATGYGTYNGFLTSEETPYCDTYGRLYDWEAILGLPGSGCNRNKDCTSESENYQGICPPGWHLPTGADWGALSEIYGGETGVFRLKAKTGWLNYSTKLLTSGGTDEFGFAFLPSGTGICQGATVDHCASYSLFTVGNGGGIWTTKLTATSEVDGSSGEIDRQSLFSLRCVMGQGVKAEPPRCGGDTYNISTHFCSEGEIYSKCKGADYNPKTHFCHDNKPYLKCDGNEFNPETHFCSDGEILQNGMIHGAPVEYEGETYETVVIGKQTWMARNLNYNVEGSWCYGDKTGGDSEGNCEKYGRLYNWTTAMGLSPSCQTTSCAGQVSEKHRGVCPEGWHIPSYEDWTILINTVGSATSATKLKATSGFNMNGTKSGNGTDDFGFAALPGGFYNNGNFSNIGNGGYFWTTREYLANSATRKNILYNNESVSEAVSADKGKTSHSIRCLKD